MDSGWYQSNSGASTCAASEGTAASVAKAEAPLVLFVPRLDRIQHTIQPPAHLRHPFWVAAAMCAVEIAQQRHCERRVLKHHGHDARCIVVGRTRPRSHASTTVHGKDGRERFEGAAELRTAKVLCVTSRVASRGQIKVFSNTYWARAFTASAG